LYPNALPTVSITSPANNASFNAPASFTISASATDNGGSISKVEFYNGGIKLGEDNSAPYEYSWINVAAGSYTITTRAFDNMSAVAVSSAVTVKVNTVSNPPPVNQAPIVTLTTPANGTSWNAPASIAITANASDADGSVAKVEFYNGSAKIGEDLTSPYAFTINNAGAGTYVISVKATDNLGAVTTSSSVSVTVVTVSTDLCASLAQYVENNGYIAGSKVKNAGKRYECKEFPYSGWCNGASWAYGPGTGAYWSDAWYDRGSCNARTSEADAVATESSMLVSPNPSSGMITIHVDETSTVTLFNAQGIEVLNSILTPQGTMDISNLSSGMYMVRIDTGTEVWTRMVLKN
jgi:chitinase